MAEALRDLVDRDRDGAAPLWLGGTDCHDGDPRVGPVLREIPGDGVDQDCRGGDAPTPAPSAPAGLPAGCAAAPRSIALLVVDALRADAVLPEVMPHVTALAARSWVFERAYAPTGMTLTSVASIFAGRPLSDVAAPNPLMDGALTIEATLPERFRASGFRTAAFSDFLEHPLLRRGFAARNPVWRDQAPLGVKATLLGAATARGVLGHLGAAATPAFAWAHFSDTHARYKLDRLPDGRPASEREAYVRGVAYVDEQIGALLRELSARGLEERTIVVVTADHGEELGDHGRQGHGPHLYEEVVRVPLVVHVPGCAPSRWSDPVSLTQLGPTLGAATGVEVPGRGLFEAPGAPVVVEAPTGLSAHYKRAIVQGGLKLVVDPPNGGAVLFDVAADPTESHALDDAAARARLEAAYQAWLDAPGAR